MKGTEAFGLAGKTAVVVGGTRGIGREISLQFARSGARVLANFVRDATAAHSLTEIAASEALDLQVVKGDVSRDSGIAALREQLDVQMPQLSILVFAAATGVHRYATELSNRHFDFTFALNVRAFLEVAQLCRARMSQGGAIVALSSEGAERAIPTYSLVGASKAALESLCRHLAVEWGAAGIRVNVLSPGSVPTDAWTALPDAERRLASAVERAPLRRLASALDVALAAQFLCSNGAACISGTTLVVDAGARIAG
jgi:enoyl-[acyl-carrier protein] reductase III